MQEPLGNTGSAPLRDGEGAARPSAAPSARTGGQRKDDRRSRARRLPVLVEYLDVVLLLIVTAPALVLGAPVLGFVVGAAGWLLQRVLGKTDKRFIQAREPRTQLGLNLFEAFGRIWLLAGAIVIAGVAGSRADGLTAALVIFGAYSVAFVVRVFAGPPNRPRAAGRGAGGPTSPRSVVR
jgi:hypothetical protein